MTEYIIDKPAYLQVCNAKRTNEETEERALPESVSTGKMPIYNHVSPAVICAAAARIANSPTASTFMHRENLRLFSAVIWSDIQPWQLQEVWSTEIINTPLLPTDHFTVTGNSSFPLVNLPPADPSNVFCPKPEKLCRSFQVDAIVFPN